MSPHRSTRLIVRVSCTVGLMARVDGLPAINTALLLSLMSGGGYLWDTLISFQQTTDN